MKKLLFAIIALLPFTAMAQNAIENNQQANNNGEQKQRALFERSNTDKRNPKYLVGAVPVVDGKVVFSTSVKAPGKSAQQIYDLVTAELEKMTKEPNQFKDSKMQDVNKPGKVVGARFKEWLVFQKSPLSLDQTIFNYTLICDCTDGQLNITLSHISYEYETDRTDTGVGQEMTAEQWITDEYALTRNKQKLARYSGKFRSKTIDRKDFIFNRFANLLK